MISPISCLVFPKSLAYNGYAILHGWILLNPFGTTSNIGCGSLSGSQPMAADARLASPAFSSFLKGCLRRLIHLSQLWYTSTSYFQSGSDNRLTGNIHGHLVYIRIKSRFLVYCLDYISLNDLPEFPSATLVYALLRSMRNVCQWHTVLSVNDAPQSPSRRSEDVASLVRLAD